MRESSIEQRLGARLQRLGCLFYKFVSPGNNGVPDRIVITPGGTVVFAELKTETGRLSAEQRVQIKRITDHRARAVVIYGKPGADSFVREVERLIREEGGAS